MKRAKRYAGRGCDSHRLHHKHIVPISWVVGSIPVVKKGDGVSSQMLDDVLLKGAYRFDWCLVGKWRTGAEATISATKTVSANDNFAHEDYRIAA